MPLTKLPSLVSINRNECLLDIGWLKSSFDENNLQTEKIYDQLKRRIQSINGTFGNSDAWKILDDRVLHFRLHPQDQTLPAYNMIIIIVL
jgi:hypothetical protein